MAWGKHPESNMATHCSVTVLQARSMFLQHAEDFIDLPRFMQVLEHYNLTWCILFNYQDTQEGAAASPDPAGRPGPSRSPSSDTLLSANMLAGSHGSPANSSSKPLPVRRSQSGRMLARQRSFSSEVVDKALRAAASMDRGNSVRSVGNRNLFGAGSSARSNVSGPSMHAAIERHRSLILHQDSFNSMQAGLSHAESVCGRWRVAIEGCDAGSHQCGVQDLTELEESWQHVRQTAQELIANKIGNAVRRSWGTQQL